MTITVPKQPNDHAEMAGNNHPSFHPPRASGDLDEQRDRKQCPSGRNGFSWMAVSPRPELVMNFFLSQSLGELSGLTKGMEGTSAWGMALVSRVLELCQGLG